MGKWTEPVRVSLDDKIARTEELLTTLKEARRALMTDPETGRVGRVRRPNTYIATSRVDNGPDGAGPQDV